MPSLSSCYKPLLAALVLTALSAPASQAAPIPTSGTWATTLQARDLDGNGSADAYYDTQLDITWLATINSRQRTDQHLAWVQSLAPGGIGDWRLPNLRDTGDLGCDQAFEGTDCGANVQTRLGDITYSELAHLFYVTLGNQSRYDTLGNERPGVAGVDFGLANNGPFQGLSDGTFITGTAYAPADGNSWAFNVDIGWQNRWYDGDRSLAMAVHEGDVGRSVPEPQGLALALSSLLALGWSRQRRRPA